MKGPMPAMSQPISRSSSRSRATVSFVWPGSPIMNPLPVSNPRALRVFRQATRSERVPQGCSES